MISPATSRARTFALASTFIFVLLVAAQNLYAQTDTGIDSEPGDPGMGGAHTIQGRIFAPSGRQLGRRVRVRLGGVRGESSVLSDDHGAFTFRRLNAGTYRLTVEAGKEFETTTETVDIIDSPLRNRRAGQIVSVQIQLRLKREEGAGKPGVLNAALAAIPLRARELYEKALRSAKDGERKRAVEQLKQAISIYPKFALALNELGVQYLNLGETERAAEALRSALSLGPDAFVLRLNYGIVLLQQKRFAEAEAELSRALRLSDASFAAHLHRARALIGLARYEEAEQECLRAIALGGEAARMAHRYLGAIYIERGEQARAVEALETYLRLDPKAAEAAQIRALVKQLRAELARPRK
ncbi:MAG TPA: tetratricopeptide repeat protein [Pyrinomonadaceae bacterium]|jgi:tetratricopeptide (TPR) repeat protein